MPTVAQLQQSLEQIAPLSLAAAWDNVGLLLGDSPAEIHRVMTCLTITATTAQEAIDAGAQMVVSHHPIFFRPTQKLTTTQPEQRFLWQLARAGIAVYSAHTAYDNAPGGINDQLAHLLGLTQIQSLRAIPGPSQCKLVVFVPEGDLSRVTDALFAAGAGKIANYCECSYRLLGTGTFFGTETTNPVVGQKGRREEVTEWRLEVVCPEGLIGAIIAAMKKAHSYEVPAFDIYPLFPVGLNQGEGRVGLLPAPTPLESLAHQVAKALGMALVPWVGRPEKPIQMVALACGAAGEFLSDAARHGADLFLTGEMRFHEILQAENQDMALLLPGHYATERPGMETMAQKIKEKHPELVVWASQREMDPLRVYSVGLTFGPPWPAEYPGPPPR